VWADVANDQQLQQQETVLGLFLQAPSSSDSVSQVAEGVGLAARRMVAAYKGVNAALDSFECIMKQHKALQVRLVLWCGLDVCAICVSSVCSAFRCD
jgi:hypothetical protein